MGMRDKYKDHGAPGVNLENLTAQQWLDVVGVNLNAALLGQHSAIVFGGVERVAAEIAFHCISIQFT